MGAMASEGTGWGGCVLFTSIQSVEFYGSEAVTPERQVPGNGVKFLVSAFTRLSH